MMNRFKINSPEGELVFRDSQLDYPEIQNVKSASKDHSFLCFICEGELVYDIGIIVDEWPEDSSQHNYEQDGGHFGVNVKSGVLEICTAENWKSNTTHYKVNVSPGDYIATVFYKDFNYAMHKDLMIQKAGYTEYQYYELIDKLGLYAWIPNLLFLVSLLSSYGRSIGLYSLSVVLLTWMPYFLLRTTKRYKAIEAAREELENSTPSYMIQLKKLPSGQRIPGGYQYIN